VMTSGRRPPEACQPSVSFFANIGSIEIGHGQFFYNGVEVTGADDSDDQVDSSDGSDDDELDYRQHTSRYLNAVKMQRRMRRMKKEAEAQARSAQEEVKNSCHTTEDERPKEELGGQDRKQRQASDLESELQDVQLDNTSRLTPSRGRNRGNISFSMFNIQRGRSDVETSFSRKDDPPKSQESQDVHLDNTSIQVRGCTPSRGRKHNKISFSMYNIRRAPDDVQSSQSLPTPHHADWYTDGTFEVVVLSFLVTCLLLACVYSQ